RLPQFRAAQAAAAEPGPAAARPDCGPALRATVPVPRRKPRQVPNVRLRGRRGRFDPRGRPGDGAPHRPLRHPGALGGTARAASGVTGNAKGLSLARGEPTVDKVSEKQVIVYFGNDWSADNRTSSHH